jgi:hypothetical protein
MNWLEIIPIIYACAIVPLQFRWLHCHLSSCCCCLLPDPALWQSTALPAGTAASYACAIPCAVRFPPVQLSATLSSHLSLCSRLSLSSRPSLSSHSLSPQRPSPEKVWSVFRCHEFVVLAGAACSCHVHHVLMAVVNTSLWCQVMRLF